MHSLIYIFIEECISLITAFYKYAILTYKMKNYRSNFLIEYKYFLHIQYLAHQQSDAKHPLYAKAGQLT